MKITVKQLKQLIREQVEEIRRNVELDNEAITDESLHDNLRKRAFYVAFSPDDLSLDYMSAAELKNNPKLTYRDDKGDRWRGKWVGSRLPSGYERWEDVRDKLEWKRTEPEVQPRARNPFGDAHSDVKVRGKYPEEDM
jgi:hypothetical protein